MKSVATVTLGGPLLDKLDAIAKAGFEGVELVEKDLQAFKGGAREVARRAEDLGLKIIALQPLRDFEGSPRHLRGDRITQAERMFDNMEELGTQMLILCSNVSADSSPDDDVLAQDLLALAERAALRGFRVGYEALSWGAHINSYRQAWKLVSKVGHSHLGLVLDTFHTCCLRDDLNALGLIPPERIFCVQVADAPFLPLDFLQWSRHFRCLPGVGSFNLVDFLSPLLANGYDGPLSLEVFSDIYAALPAGSVAGHAFSSLLELESVSRTVRQAAAA